MKKNLLKFTAFLLILSCIASSCNNGPDPVEYPIDISFTEYSLQETSCQWMNLPYDEKVMIINSSEELEKYISCSIGSSYPAIDFSKKTLLLVSGKTNSGVIELIVKNLQQLSINKYQLSIEFDSFDNNNFSKWKTALLVEKLKQEDYIDLNVTLFSSHPELCYCIMDTLRGEWKWIKKHGGNGGNTTDSEFKSIIKFLSQNEDTSINYEVLVEDTIFCKGSFQIQYVPQRRANIKLPHPIPQINPNWFINFGDGMLGVPNGDESTLRLWDGGIDGYYYYYQKIGKE